MRRLWRLGQRLGLVASVVCWLAWVGFGAVAARAAAVALSSSPRVAGVAVGLIGGAVAVGGLIGYWIVAITHSFAGDSVETVQLVAS